MTVNISEATVKPDFHMETMLNGVYISEAIVTLSASNPCMNKFDWLNLLLLHTATRYCFLVGIVRLEAR